MNDIEDSSLIVILAGWEMKTGAVFAGKKYELQSEIESK